MTFCLALAVYAVVFFQAFHQGVRNWTGAQIDLLPGLLVYVALAQGPRAMAFFALGAGLLYDSVSANPLGISVGPLLLIGTVVFQNRELILKEQRYAQFVLGLGASAAAPLLTVMFLLLAGKQPLLGWGSLWQWLVMALAGGAMTPLWFHVFGRLEKALTHPASPETSAFQGDREMERGRR